MSTQLEEQPEPQAASGQDRVLSVDVLRGFDMFWIVGAGSLAMGLKEVAPSSPLIQSFAAQFEHAAWEGFRFEDLIFPLFAFMVGMSIVFSLRKYQGAGTKAVYGRIVRRFVLMYLLGILYYGGFSHTWPQIRLVGVLQRLALCYLFASLLYLNLKPRALIAVGVGVLVGYWVLLAFVPVPGLGHASFAAGENWSCWFDAHFLPGKRIEKGMWDPEGLLSTIPAVVSSLLGVLAALWLGVKKDNATKAAALIGLGMLLVVFGFVWGSEYAGRLQFPVIKKIWTSSYVLVAGGYSAILLGVFIFIVDVFRVQFWIPPFLWIGSNALAVYMAVNLFDFGGLAERFAGGNVEALLDAVTPGLGSMGLDLAQITLTLLLARFLYMRKIFIRV